MDTEKRRRFIINFLFFAIIAGILWFTLNYLVVWLFPFIVGFLLAYLMNPLINWITRKTRVKRKFLAYFFTLSLAAVLGLLVWLAGYLAMKGIGNYFYLLPDIFRSQIQPALTDFNTWLNTFIGSFTPGVSAELIKLQASLMEELQKLAVNLSTSGLVALTKFTRSLPSVLLTFIFTILATIFTNIDFPVVKNFIVTHIPRKFEILARNIRIAFVETVGRYLTAYLKIMSVTFL